MSDADRVGDELHSRLRGLARGAEQTSVPGLADVRRRQARRQRNTMLATAVAVVGVVGAAALVLQPLGDDPSIQPIGPGLTASRTAETGTTTPSTSATAPPSTTPSTSTSTGTSTSTSTGTSTSSAPPVDPEEPADEILAIDLGSLVTVDELAAAGVPAAETDVGDDGQPTLPWMCTASSWQEQYSGPADFVSGTYSLGAGLLYVDLLGYPSAPEANLALVKLKEDARACPVVNEFLSIEVTAVGLAVGEEFVTFRMDSESGEDGTVSPIWVTIARVGNVLVSSSVTEDQLGDTSDNEQITRDAAQANVDHLLAG